MSLSFLAKTASFSRSSATAGALAAALLFALLTFLRVQGMVSGTQSSFALSPASQWVQWVAWITHAGEAQVVGAVVLAAAGWVWWRGERRRAGLAVATYAVAIALVWAVKHLTAIPRPGAGVIMEDGWSYPSGHAALSLVGYGLVALLIASSRVQRRLFLGGALLVACIMGISRIVLGVHTLWDVVGGWLLGAALLLGALAWDARVSQTGSGGGRFMKRQSVAGRSAPLVASQDHRSPLRED